MRRKGIIGRLAAAGAVLCVAALALPAQERPAESAAYEGFTRPSLDVSVGSRVEGLVEAVLVTEGQRVKRGQVILRLDATVERIEADLSRLRLESDHNIEAMELIASQKETDLKRAKALLEKGGITGVEVEQKELELKVARLNVEIARSRRQAAELEHQRDLARLAQREITAPCDGVVTQIHKDPGESVERLEAVAQVVQLDPLEIVLNLPAATVGSHAAGESARVALAGHDKPLEATVKTVSPVVDFASNTYRVTLTLPNPGGKLPAGLRATVHFAGK